MNTRAGNFSDTSDSQGAWLRMSLGDICQIVRGVSYKKTQASDKPSSGLVPVLRATNIKDEALVLDSDLVYVPADVVSEEQMLRVGDIVVATSSGSKHLVGKTGQVKAAWVGSFGAFCAVLRPKMEIEHRYLGYFFGSKEYKDFISKKALGVNINNLRRGDLEEISVPVAPLNQQKQIVAEIEKQLSRLNEAVANLKRVKANLNRYKASVLKAAVEGRLVETEAEIARREGRDYETGEQLLERILETHRKEWKGKGKYKEPTGPVTSDLPGLPEGWVWASVDQLAEVGTGATPLRSRREYFEGGKIPWVTSGALNEEFISATDEFITELAVQETNAKIFPVHTLLIAMYGEGKTRGKVSELLIESATNQACAAIVTNGFSERVREFMKLFFLKNYEDIRRLSSGGVQPNLNLSHIKTTAIPLPPISEQRRVVAEIERRFSLLRETETQVDANLQRAEYLRQSILAKAFSGGLVT